jgi:hypothetical protein
MIEADSVDDLRAALTRRDVADLAVEEAKRVLKALGAARLALSTARAEQKLAHAAVEEILAEIKTGTSRYPILESANGAANVDEPFQARITDRSFTVQVPDDDGPTWDEAGTSVETDRVAAFGEREKELAKQKRRERDARRKERAEAGRDRQAIGTSLPRDDDDDVHLDDQVEQRLAAIDAEANESEPAGDLDPAARGVLLDPAARGVLSWTSSDLERELFHALTHRIGSGGEATWAELRKLGATIEDIRLKLAATWPRHGKTFVPASESGGKHGYTITIGGTIPYFWLGPFRGPGHKATLAGTQVTDRVRTVLEIPTPAAVAKAAGGRPVAAPPSYRTVPDDGWDEASIKNAADELEARAAELRMCLNCEAVWGPPSSTCPSCLSRASRQALAVVDEAKSGPAPARKPPGRGPDRGSEAGKKKRQKGSATVIGNSREKEIPGVLQEDKG